MNFKVQVSFHNPKNTETIYSFVYDSMHIPVPEQSRILGNGAAELNIISMILVKVDSKFQWIPMDKCTIVDFNEN